MAMKKQLIIIGIIILLVNIGFSGCTNNPLNIEKNRFIGTWKGTDSSMPSLVVTLVFFSDGTFSMNIWDASGTYDIKDSKLILIPADQSTQLAFSYVFSNNDITLTITDISGTSTMVLTKQ